MSQNYRGLIWGLVAIAGTATVAAVTYRYATRRSRRARAQEEPENELLVTNAVPLNEVGSPRLNQERAQVQNEVIEDVDHQHQYQNQDQVLQPTVQEVVDSEIQTSNMQRMQQQLVLVTREGNLVRYDSNADRYEFWLIDKYQIAFVGLWIKFDATCGLCEYDSSFDK
jgi:hypothetical protein